VNGVWRRKCLLLGHNLHAIGREPLISLQQRRRHPVWRAERVIGTNGLTSPDLTLASAPSARSKFLSFTSTPTNLP
jgi:hypothetical protein